MSIASRIIFLCILIIHSDADAEELPISCDVEAALPLEYPFVVSIARKFNIPPKNPQGHNCGGALINSRSILALASCFSVGKNTSDYFVYAGSSDLSLCKKYEIKSWTTYDDWLASKHRFFVDAASAFANNDIAIVHLVATVELPASETGLLRIRLANHVGLNVTTAGWGLLFDDTMAQHSDLRVIGDEECKGKIRTQLGDPSYTYESNLFCTNGVTLFATLGDGDRGSPVFVLDGRGDYRIVGVNLRSEPVPTVGNFVEKVDQQNLHLGIYDYIRFINEIAESY